MLRAAGVTKETRPLSLQAPFQVPGVLALQPLVSRQWKL